VKGEIATAVRRVVSYLGVVAESRFRFASLVEEGSLVASIVSRFGPVVQRDASTTPLRANSVVR
jgi:hypothetical protein